MKYECPSACILGKCEVYSVSDIGEWSGSFAIFYEANTFEGGIVSS